MNTDRHNTNTAGRVQATCLHIFAHTHIHTSITYTQLEECKRRLLAAEDELLIYKDDKSEMEQLVSRIRSLEAEKQKQK
jgi:hypothetical protein